VISVVTGGLATWALGKFTTAFDALRQQEQRSTQSALANVYSKVLNIENVFAPIKVGLCALLRVEIIAECRKYIKDNKINLYDFEALSALYDTYKTLGGNGFVISLINEVQKLPKIDAKE
jgi:hypothetical protein